MVGGGPGQQNSKLRPEDRVLRDQARGRNRHRRGHLAGDIGETWPWFIGDAQAEAQRWRTSYMQGMYDTVWACQ